MGERLMRATRERTNGRRAARDFRTRVYARRRVQRSDCYTSTAGIVIAAPAANPASTLRVYVHTRVYTCNPELRPSAHSQMHVEACERKSE